MKTKNYGLESEPVIVSELRLRIPFIPFSFMLFLSSSFSEMLNMDLIAFVFRSYFAMCN